jgi:hypothetical protein
VQPLSSVARWLEALRQCPQWTTPDRMSLELGRMLARRPRVSAFPGTSQASYTVAIHILWLDHGKQSGN